MPWSGSTRLNHPHLMRQAAWLPAEGSPLWDTWRSRTLRSAAAPTGARGSSGPPPERDGRSGSLGTWRLRTPPERSAEPRARGVRIGTWRSRTRLWGPTPRQKTLSISISGTRGVTGPVPTWWSRSEAVGPVRRSRTAGSGCSGPQGVVTDNYACISLDTVGVATPVWVHRQ